jgi:hypothetical protein
MGFMACRFPAGRLCVPCLIIHSLAQLGPPRTDLCLPITKFASLAADASLAKRELKVTCRPVYCAPHVCARAVVEPKAFLGLAEVAADNVGEFLELDLHVRIKRV